MKIFRDRVALVTGGASGIGFGIVQCLLEAGMKVVVADYNAEHLADAQRTLDAADRVHCLRVDVSDRNQMREAAKEIAGVFGKLHVLCNNAGISGGGAADDPDFEDWDCAMAVNLGGVVNGVKILAPLIRAHGEGGHIVNTASMAGVVRLPMLGAYSTAKFAVRGFTESLRLSMAPHGIGVSCLFPGLTRSRILSGPVGGAAYDADDPVAAKAFAELESMMAGAMDPLEVGRAVVQGIIANAPYIFTHGEFRAEVAELCDEMLAAFPDASGISAACSAFEELRRQAVADLQRLPIKD